MGTDRIVSVLFLPYRKQRRKTHEFTSSLSELAENAKHSLAGEHRRNCCLRNVLYVRRVGRKSSLLDFKWDSGVIKTLLAAE